MDDLDDPPTEETLTPRDMRVLYIWLVGTLAIMAAIVASIDFLAKAFFPTINPALEVVAIGVPNIVLVYVSSRLVRRHLA
jgi:hypothetical protein